MVFLSHVYGILRYYEALLPRIETVVAVREGPDCYAPAMRNLRSPRSETPQLPFMLSDRLGYGAVIATVERIVCIP